MKICIVPTMFPKYKGDYYGSFVFDEAKSLVDKGFEVHVVTQHNPNTSYDEIVDGLHVHRFRWLEPKEFRALVHFRGLKDNLRLLTYMISLFFKLVMIISKYKIDIVHAHSTIPTGLLAVIVTKIFRIHSFVTAHGMDINNFQNNMIFSNLISFSLNHSDKVIAVSTDLAEKIKDMGVNENKIIVLMNAVDINRFRSSDTGDLRSKYGVRKKDVLLLFVGYLDTFKGIFELINAVYGLYKENKNIKLIIVGTGPKYKELEKKVFELGLDQSVIFAGTVLHNTIHKYFQAADIFILPSYSEGLPVSILEAMASNTPVIASNVGGIPEIIDDGKNGFIIPPKNESILRNKLMVLVNDVKLRENFAIKSAEIIRDKFDNNKKINELIELYLETIEN